ncbi:DNA repair endonuclease XPF mei-9 [Rhipicephalus microplus]|uniref:DNA repair endonuclease XPF mei-9 n=1 Tax=Rhipicephalus microplus TaxID=6941 RepID=UPI003F6AEBD4
MSLLEFETQMFLDLHNEDGLVIVAKGLGIERLLLSLIKVHNDPGSLVLILGTTAEEEEFFISQLQADNVNPLPKCITADCGTKERTDVYLTGGALFVTSRILVVDMLMERVPINLITGIIVYRAHKTLESCQEAFILRLYRQKNKTGFVKGLSDSAVAFTHGFSQVQRMMRNLFVKKLFLWPRFQADVISSLEKRKPEVVEIRVAMTPAMNIIQMAILDIIASCVREIKKCNPSIEMEDITVENTIARSFEKIVKFQLDPIWHQIGPKTKRLVSDIKTLRTLLLYLTQHDCVTFYSLVKSIHDSATAMTQVSDWLFLDAADTLYVQAKARVYGVDKRSHKDDQKQKNPDKKVDPSFQPEHSPKWAALSEILAEIKEENKEKADLNTVLIVAEDDRTCGQLSEYLCSGADTVLCNLYRKAVGDKDGLQLPPLGRSDDNSGESPGKRRKKAKSASDGQKKKGNQDSEMEGSDMTETETEGMESPPAFPNTIFHPLKSSEFALQQLLHSVEPKYIILYDANIATVREIEMYQATRAKEVLRVYFLMYEDSIDEQRYLTSLRREKDAFEFLIKEKSIMVIPEEQDGKGEYHPDLIDDLGKSNEPASSRKAGGAVAPVSTSRRVIVDLREFRSELPSLIHRRGINVQPVTIEVGDYILTPEICVERKSLNDLIGSLNNGRLYNQAQAMCRYYKRPVLLIEFNQNQPFCLQGKHVPSSESTSSQTFVSKLILLTMHFPRLRLLWCQSPYATAEIFDILKHGKEEPSVAEAQAVTEKELQDSGKSSDKYNPAPQDFLLHLPGVSLKNYTSLMRKFTSLADMFKASEEELSSVMGNAAQAKALWQAIHNPIEHNPQKAVPQRKFRKK